jgi:hypothetical protein
MLCKLTFERRLQSDLLEISKPASMSGPSTFVIDAADGFGVVPEIATETPTADAARSRSRRPIG